MAPPRILIVGKMGVGKTTVSEALIEAPMTADDSCRDAKKPYEYIVHRSSAWTIIDTSGLDGISNNEVSISQALRNLHGLLQESMGGYHAALFVIRAGRFDLSDTAALQIFASVFAGLRDRTQVVITRCENDEDWLEENHGFCQKFFSPQLGVLPRERFVCVGFPYIKHVKTDRDRAQETIFAHERAESADRLRAFVAGIVSRNAEPTNCLSSASLKPAALLHQLKMMLIQIHGLDKFDRKAFAAGVRGAHLPDFDDAAIQHALKG